MHLTIYYYTHLATSNGHAGGSRNHRRSMDKDKHRNKGDAADNEHNNGTRHGGKNSGNNQVDSAATATATVTATSSNSKDKDKEKSDWDSSTSYPQQQQQGGKEKHGKWLDLSPDMTSF